MYSRYARGNIEARRDRRMIVAKTKGSRARAVGLPSGTEVYRTEYPNHAEWCAVRKGAGWVCDCARSRAKATGRTKAERIAREVYKTHCSCGLEYGTGACGPILPRLRICGSSASRL